MFERREQPRKELSIHVHIETPGRECPARVRDINTQGAFIEVDLKRLGDGVNEVRLCFCIDTGYQVLSRQLSGQISRRDDDGLAVRFDDHDHLGHAVVEELLYHMRYHSAVA
ncbi:MAG: PilZ domain-containing protein [Gammaproteobacteria bacterium]